VIKTPETSNISNIPASNISGKLLARNTLLNFIGQILPLIVGVVTIPFVIQGLGTERFGLLSLAWVVLGYFAIFDLGLGRATTKFVAEALGRGDEKKSRLWLDFSHNSGNNGHCWRSCFSRGYSFFSRSNFKCPPGTDG